MRKYSLFFLLPFLVALTSCDYIFPSTWNYRITVEIETPEGVKSGSAVRKVVARKSYHMGLASEVISAQVYGEAVVIDLGERGVVFALINWDSYNEVYKAFPKSFKSSSERLKYYRNLKSGTKAELLEHIPKMYFFPNSKRSRSNELLYMYQHSNIINNFTKIFGSDVKLKKVTVEITHDQVTTGVVDSFIPPFSGGHYSVKYINFKRGFK